MKIDEGIDQGSQTLDFIWLTGCADELLTGKKEHDQMKRTCECRWKEKILCNLGRIKLGYDSCPYLITLNSGR